MVTICCTQRLLKRTGFLTESLADDTTTALGSWFANLLFFHRTQIMLFVSDKSRLAVVTPAKDARSMSSHLTQHLSALLARLGAAPEWVDAEIREMADVHFSTTHSRSVLGTMNDYKIQIEALLDKAGDAHPLEIALHLSGCPCGPLDYRSPHVVALELLKGRHGSGD